MDLLSGTTETILTLTYGLEGYDDYFKFIEKTLTIEPSSAASDVCYGSYTNTEWWTLMS